MVFGYDVLVFKKSTPHRHLAKSAFLEEQYFIYKLWCFCTTTTSPASSECGRKILVYKTVYTLILCAYIFKSVLLKVGQYYNRYLKLWTHNVGMKTKYTYIRWAAIEFGFIYLTMYCMTFKEVLLKTYMRKIKHSLGNVCPAINIAQLRQNMVLSPVNNLLPPWWYYLFNFCWTVRCSGNFTTPKLVGCPLCLFYAETKLLVNSHWNIELIRSASR